MSLKFVRTKKNLLAGKDSSRGGVATPVDGEGSARDGSGQIAAVEAHELLDAALRRTHFGRESQLWRVERTGRGGGQHLHQLGRALVGHVQRRAFSNVSQRLD
jgi:hypothetical protein